MSRKDFQLIADVLRIGLNVSRYAPGRYTAEEIVEDIIEDMAIALQDTNPRFDKKKFINACGR